ncbi:hypothetical protein BKI52_29440 [marine bacterium AO1-C]|nr:hypothetical protein BKI52_29440 [marine bacterium AO1-C]
MKIRQLLTFFNLLKNVRPVFSIYGILITWLSCFLLLVSCTNEQRSKNLKEEAIALQKKDLKQNIRAKDLPHMVYIEGGSFMMGNNNENEEKPVHKVIINDFYMSKYEVTQRQWKLLMGENPSRFKACDNCPVEQVSWHQVQEFIKKMNAKTGDTYRLPTEAEWEYAARGGKKSKGYKYAGSNNIDEVAWYLRNSGDRKLVGESPQDNLKANNCKTHPVGEKLPNELGLYDMSGNVDEWCSDWYRSDYYSNSAINNPKGPNKSNDRVFRGGCWRGSAYRCRSTCRISFTPESQAYYLGFRVVKVIN